MNIIITKEMKVEFTTKEKETIRDFYKLIDRISDEMLEEGIETIEINGNNFTDTEIIEMENNIWCIL